MRSAGVFGTLLGIALVALPAGAQGRSAAAAEAFALEFVSALRAKDPAAFELLLPLAADVEWYIANRVPRTVIRDDPTTFADPAAVHGELVDQLRQDFALWLEIVEYGIGLPTEDLRYVSHALASEPIPDEFQSHVLTIVVAVPFPDGVELMWDVTLSVMEISGRYVASFWFPEYTGFLERKTPVTDTFVERIVPSVYTPESSLVGTIVADESDIRWFLDHRLPRDFREQIPEYGLDRGVDPRRLEEWLDAWGLPEPASEMNSLRADVAALAAGRRIDDVRVIGYCLPLSEGYPLFSHAFVISLEVLYETGEVMPYSMKVGAMQGEGSLFLGSHPEGAGIQAPPPDGALC